MCETIALFIPSKLEKQMIKIITIVIGIVIIQIKFKYFKFLFIKKQSKIEIIIVKIISNNIEEISSDCLSPLIIVDDIIEKEINVNILINLLFFLNIIKFNCSVFSILFFVPISNNLNIQK